MAEVTRPRETERVAYVGDAPERAVGTEGTVISEAGSGSHVQWDDGSVSLEGNYDIVVQPGHHTASSITYGGLTSFSARSAYDRRGGLGVVKHLNDEGHIAAMVPIVEEAYMHLAASLRSDPSVREVLAQLDEDEGADVIGLLANVLLHDVMEG